MQWEPSLLISFIQSVFTLHVLLELKNVTYRKRADPLHTGPDKVNFRFRLAVDGMPTHLVLWPLQAFCFGHLVVQVYGEKRKKQAIFVLVIYFKDLNNKSEVL